MTGEVGQVNAALAEARWVRCKEVRVGRESMLTRAWCAPVTGSREVWHAVAEKCCGGRWAVREEGETQGSRGEAIELVLSKSDGKWLDEARGEGSGRVREEVS